MNGWDVLDAVGNIDAAYIESAAKENAPAVRSPAGRGMKTAVAAVACVAAVAIGLAVRHAMRIAREPASLYGEEGSIIFGTDSAGNTATDIPSTEGIASDTTSAATSAAGESDPGTEKTGELPSTGDEPSQAETVTTPPPSTDQPAPETATEPDGGYSGGAPTPSAYAETAPTVRGTGYTATEIAAVLEREGFAIAQMAAAETGCAAGDVRILTEGYCHTSLGEENVVDLDYLILPVCVGDRMVASVDLFRADGEIHYSVSAGGPRWDNLNRALAYGEVAFAYAGYGELAVAADGTVFEITAGVAQAVAGIDGLYARVASPHTVFSLSKLQTANDVSPGV